MSKTINVNIRIDEELKKQAEQLFSELGMNMTTAFNVFVRQSIRNRGIPFEITARNDDFNSDYNQQVLKQSIERLEQGKGTVHELIEVD